MNVAMLVDEEGSARLIFVPQFVSFMSVYPPIKGKPWNSSLGTVLGDAPPSVSFEATPYVVVSVAERDVVQVYRRGLLPPRITNIWWDQQPPASDRLVLSSLVEHIAWTTPWMRDRPVAGHEAYQEHHEPRVEGTDYAWNPEQEGMRPVYARPPDGGVERALFVDRPAATDDGIIWIRGRIAHAWPDGVSVRVELEDGTRITVARSATWPQESIT